MQQFVQDFFEASSGEPISNFHKHLRREIDHFFQAHKHGRQAEWDELIQSLPNIATTNIDLNHSHIRINGQETPDDLESLLKEFTPWRKGPFNFFGTIINTEWRSDWKWDRIQPHISDLSGRAVLDIGCGNGYHLWRMLGDGASFALGVDPTRLFLYQFHIAKHFMPEKPAYLLPLRSENLPRFKLFDTVFSLGVLYHRRSPIDHLTELFSFLRPGGELVLETLVVDGDARTILTPVDRYAKMANVWFLPSTSALEIWLDRAGFRNIRTVDINQTSVEEQRSTEWMTFHSLAEFLDPDNANLTAEGLPAPKRAILIAEKP
ncbi:MAG: tRNA 5-methoxyuridine(34)/uridine 5-oxyacetic acid(34) synthase CmoB [Pseudomonadales bacterium]|nr:tRNA 5-methoxyuridine(34)/uridine 5-oxyacetic acid(34) synthase CmoB [Pseudomonadales bacterium]